MDTEILYHVLPDSQKELYNKLYDEKQSIATEKRLKLKEEQSIIDNMIRQIFFLIGLCITIIGTSLYLIDLSSFSPSGYMAIGIIIGLFGLIITTDG